MTPLALGALAAGGGPVEEAPPPEPADESHADPLGEAGEVGRRDGPGRQEGDAVRGGGEDAVGRTHVEVDVAVEGGAEAVEEGDDAEPPPGGWRGLAVTPAARQVGQEPLDLVQEGSELRLDVRRDGPVAEAPRGEPGLEVAGDDAVERGLLGTTALVALWTPGMPRAGATGAARSRRA